MLDDWRERFNNKANFQKLFTPKELQLFPGKPNTGSLAGRYIIKKLLFDYLKAEGDFREIEILSNELGKPLLGLSDQLKELVLQRGIMENINT